MGGRLSRARAPDGISEIPKAGDLGPLSGYKNHVNYGRRLALPVGVVSLGFIALIYSRTLIRAAKINAEKQRIAGGGQVDWEQQSLRNHGRGPVTATDRQLLEEAIRSQIHYKKGLAVNHPDRASIPHDEQRLQELLADDR
ncbi:hypothetical protein M011DRAFT_405848 [Sporormia fimetaria CBS 119925]|uniref:Uncharacterized protein n=1 Tax=Sporormia fimetaria CBS 119925 TaxID=1340428 RepID=A0A6A6V5J7_9PLEO|nr:hypothetical protein M011DRAFT_405848 [Sporormia fimetaria CBS 119925]